MRPWFLAVTFFLLIPLVSSSADADGWTPLFNGKDLTALKVHFKDADKNSDGSLSKDEIVDAKEKEMKEYKDKYGEDKDEKKS